MWSGSKYPRDSVRQQAFVITVTNSCFPIRTDSVTGLWTTSHKQQKCLLVLSRVSIPSVLVSVHLYQRGSHWTDFREIWYWPLLRKSVEKFQILYKSDQNIRHFTWRRKQWRTEEFFSGGGGSTNSIEDRGQRGPGSRGGNPLVRGSGGSCNLVQEISFHIVKFS